MILNVFADQLLSSLDLLFEVADEALDGVSDFSVETPLDNLLSSIECISMSESSLLTSA